MKAPSESRDNLLYLVNSVRILSSGVPGPGTDDVNNSAGGGEKENEQWRVLWPRLREIWRAASLQSSVDNQFCSGREQEKSVVDEAASRCLRNF